MDVADLLGHIVHFRMSPQTLSKTGEWHPDADFPFQAQCDLKRLSMPKTDTELAPVLAPEWPWARAPVAMGGDGS